MRNILMRANMSILDNYDAHYVLTRDSIGKNIGNMLFPYSVQRTLTTEDTKIQTYRGITEKDADYINENFDYFVIPLANAFRGSFMKALNNITALVKKLKIPCVVVGAGMQAPLNISEDNSFPFDEDVKNFCSAILDKSAMIGVRGELTYQYLNRLGFGKHTTIIGCPSMFMYGDTLPLHHIDALTADSRICINTQSTAPTALWDFFDRCEADVNDYYYILQDLHELMLLYAGVPFSDKLNTPAQMVSSPTDHAYLENRLRTFINVPTWLDFLKQADFNMGCRIHGNVAAVLSGTPTFLFAHDSRVLELAEYHNLPHMMVQDVDESLNIFDLYEKTDFKQVQRGHKQRFDHFIDFLNLNGLDNIYNTPNFARGSAPLDKMVSNITLQPPVEGIFSASNEEIAQRLHNYGKYQQKYNGKIMPIKKLC